MEVDGQIHAPSALFPGKEPPPPSTHLIGDWMGPKAGLDAMDKTKSLLLLREMNSEPSVVHSVA
jgi:hypothetical protein